MGKFEIDIYNQYGLNEKAKASTCPLCSHTRKKNKDKCMSLDWERGLGTCNHCGEVVQLHTYKSNKATTKIDVSFPPPVTYDMTDKALKFFESRGISQRALSIAKVSESLEWMPQFKKEVDTICFNYFEDGKLVNTKYRGPQKSFKLKKGGKLTLSGIDRWKDESEVVIVEGEMDELSYIEAGISNVASVPNGATEGNASLEYLDNCIDYFDNKDKIYISVDNDKAGECLRLELIRRLGSDKCYIVNLDEHKDANECLMSKGAEALASAFLNAAPCPIHNVNTYEDEKEAYYEFLENGIEGGYTIGLSSFDKDFSVYSGQIIVVTGIPSHGKSDFVDQMVLGYAREKGIKTAYASPENKPNFLHINKLIAKVYGKFPSKGDIGKPIFKRSEEFVDKHINFIDFEEGYDLEAVLSKGTELVRRKGIKCLVIDPYNKVPLKGRKREEDSYTVDYLLELDRWARKNDVIPILVAHPTKMKKGQGETKPPMPDMYSIRGTGDFYDMCPMGICVYRDFELETTIIKNLKVKFSFQGTTGAETTLMWNPENGRYSPTEGDHEDGIVTPIFDNTPWVMNEEEQFQERGFVMPQGSIEECPF